MKHQTLLTYLLLLGLSSCMNVEVKNKQNDTSTAEFAADTTLSSSEYIASTDELILIPLQTGDTLQFSKNQYQQIKDLHPELFHDLSNDPDISYSKVNDQENFGSELGVDSYYALYAHLLKEKNGSEFAVKERNQLIHSFQIINEIFANLKHGGSYFGHQQWRILAYAEYSVSLLKSDEEGFKNKFNMEAQKSLYLQGLRQVIEDEINLNKQLPASEKKKELAKINQLTIDLSQVIKSLFVLRQVQEFQYRHYGYY